MKHFSPWEYLCIDVANNHHSGLDKQRFEDRIDWVLQNITTLEDEAKGEERWKERPLYIKAVAALRKAQRGEPTGHLVGFDAICSGMQIMSALTGCREGARATGLVDPDRRADAYQQCSDLMSQKLGVKLPDNKKKVKNAVMTSLYGSKKEPQKEFGKDTPELQAFYESMMEICPGPVELLQALLDSWNPYSTYHHWVLPDGFNAVVKVMQPDEHRIEVEELDRASFTYMFYENKGKKKDVKNAANVIHSIDAYVLRSLVRRCNYDPEAFRNAFNWITDTLLMRELNNCEPCFDSGQLSEKVCEYWDLYIDSGIADIVAIPQLTTADIEILPSRYLKALQRTLNKVLCSAPFEVVTIHDDFRCHPNNMDVLRQHYNDILAELSAGTVLDFILTQLYKYPLQWDKSDPDLWKTIQNANYALC